MYCAGRPKLKIVVSLIVTVPPPLPPGQIFTTRSWTRSWSTLPRQALISAALLSNAMTGAL